MISWLKVSTEYDCMTQRAKSKVLTWERQLFWAQRTCSNKSDKGSLDKYDEDEAEDGDKDKNTDTAKDKDKDKYKDEDKDEKSRLAHFTFCRPLPVLRLNANTSQLSFYSCSSYVYTLHILWNHFSSKFKIFL